MGLSHRHLPAALVLACAALLCWGCDSPGGGGGGGLPYLPGAGDGQRTAGGDTSADAAAILGDDGTPMLDSLGPLPDVAANEVVSTTDSLAPGDAPGPADLPAQPDAATTPDAVQPADVIAPDTSGPTDASDPPDTSGPPPESCDKAGFTPVKELLDIQKAKSFFAYQAQSAEAPPLDIFMLQSYQGAPYLGPSAPGSYDLAGANFEDCGLCLLALGGCTGPQTCAKSYFADEGVVHVSEWEEGGSFAGTLEGVLLREVTIDDSYHSTPVPGGETWCMDGYSFDVPWVKKVTMPECVTAGSGTDLGDNIADFALTAADGTKTSLHAHCGKVKALWIVAVAGWCTACESYLPNVMSAYKTYQGAGLELMVVLGEDQYGNPPTVTYAKSYANKYGIPHANMFIDSGPVYGGWEVLFTYVNAYIGSDGMLSLPWDAILRGANMEYVWNYGEVGGDPGAVLTELLNE